LSVSPPYLQQPQINRALASHAKPACDPRANVLSLSSCLPPRFPFIKHFLLMSLNRSSLIGCIMPVFDFSKRQRVNALSVARNFVPRIPSFFRRASSNLPIRDRASAAGAAGPDLYLRRNSPSQYIRIFSRFPAPFSSFLCSLVVGNFTVILPRPR